MAAKILLLFIHIYRKWISPLKPPSCRFYPTCSEYAFEAVRTHGSIYGSWLSIIRIVKCGPWHKGGYDPVPPKKGLPHEGDTH